jgi:DNA-binding NarL/FixJ family response regulator
METSRPEGEHLMGTNTTRIRVLIADDRAQVRRELRTLLPLAGCAAGLQIEPVGEAGNGQEAIQQAGALRPDVVLMDLEMPLLDGYAATSQIKALCPSIRVVALTVHDSPASRVKAHEAGADAFVGKGGPVEEIVQAIRSREEGKEKDESATGSTPEEI